ncbi:MAG TPA: diguanylate cyclase [Solirubrobacteraceae bacterium]|nr:diguanylate cyclase [Solirubrobacteraceae bacterium]
MAANHSDSSDEATGWPPQYLPALALRERLEEEVNRAGRHGTPLSCLALGVEDLGEIERVYGATLSLQIQAYVGLALRSELRRFDRVGLADDGELLIVLPGADAPRAEVVARRLLGRLRALKLQGGVGERRALRIAVGLASWREGLSAQQLLADAHAALGRERLGFRDALRL